MGRTLVVVCVLLLLATAVYGGKPAKGKTTQTKATKLQQNKKIKVSKGKCGFVKGACMKLNHVCVRNEAECKKGKTCPRWKCVEKTNAPECRTITKCMKHILWCAPRDDECAEWGYEKKCKYVGGECLKFESIKKCGSLGDCVKRLGKTKRRTRCVEQKIIYYNDVHNVKCKVVDDKTKKCLKWSKPKPRKKHVCSKEKIVIDKKGKCLARAWQCVHMTGKCLKTRKRKKVCHRVKKCKRFKDLRGKAACRTKCAYRKPIGLKCKPVKYPKSFKHPMMKKGSKSEKCYLFFKQMADQGDSTMEALEKASKYKPCQPREKKIEKEIRLGNICIHAKAVCLAHDVDTVEREYHCEKARRRICMDYNREFIEAWRRKQDRVSDERDYTKVKYRKIPDKYTHLSRPCMDAMVHCHHDKGKKKARCLSKAKGICSKERKRYKNCGLWRNECAVRAAGHGKKHYCTKAKSAYCNRYIYNPKWFEFDPKSEPDYNGNKKRQNEEDSALLHLEKTSHPKLTKGSRSALKSNDKPTKQQKKKSTSAKKKAMFF